MAKKRGVRIFMSRQRLEALLEIGEEMLEEFKPLNEHHFLLAEHLQELLRELRRLLRKPQEEYLIVFNGAESVAFYQLWNMLDIRHDKYATIIVDQILAKTSRLAA